MEREARLYLLMMACYTLASSLSGMFINVFIWKLNSSFTLLAMYSLIYSLVVLTSFPLCAVYARRKTPMHSLRLGLLWMVVTYALVLYFKEQSVHHIYLIGFFMGLGSSFFAIGMHMQTLDSTKDTGRDRFLYIGNLLNGISNMIAPMLAGFFIGRFLGMTGYYLVFALTLCGFVVSALFSLKLRGKEVPAKSHLRDVWRRPTREWKGMYWITIGSGAVEGTYSTFLVTILSYTILKNELTLGGFATFSAVVSMLSSLVLAKFSRPQARLSIYTIGSVLVCGSSLLIACSPSVATLVVYNLLAAIGMNLITTTFNAWTYASIEKDPEYANRRLDYVVVREIPLGIGRTCGIVLFLALQQGFHGSILSVSFAVFGAVFLLMVPMLRKIWGEQMGIDMFKKKSVHSS